MGEERSRCSLPLIPPIYPPPSPGGVVHAITFTMLLLFSCLHMNKTKATPTPIRTVTSPLVPAPNALPLVGTSGEEEDEPVASAPSAVPVPVRVVVPWPSSPLLVAVAVVLPLPLPGSAPPVVLGARSPGAVAFKLPSPVRFATAAVAVRVGISPYKPSRGVTTTKVDVDDSSSAGGSCRCGK